MATAQIHHAWRPYLLADALEELEALEDLLDSYSALTRQLAHQLVLQTVGREVAIGDRLLERGVRRQQGAEVSPVELPEALKAGTWS